MSFLSLGKKLAVLGFGECFNLNERKGNECKGTGHEGKLMGMTENDMKGA